MATFFTRPLRPTVIHNNYQHAFLGHMGDEHTRPFIAAFTRNADTKSIRDHLSRLSAPRVVHTSVVRLDGKTVLNVHVKAYVPNGYRRPSFNNEIIQTQALCKELQARCKSLCIDIMVSHQVHIEVLSKDDLYVSAVLTDHHGVSRPG